MSRRVFYNIVLVFALCAHTPLLQAAYYPFEVFTNNGDYCDSSALDFYVVITDAGFNQVDFTFPNESLIESSIAKICFDNGTPFSVAKKDLKIKFQP